MSIQYSKTTVLALAYNAFGVERLNDKTPLVDGSGPEPTAPLNQFHVYIADNFHYPPFEPGDEPYKHSSYPTLEAAIAFCKKRLDEDLARITNHYSSAEQMYDQYVNFGEDPFIVGPVKGPLFSGWTYAKQRCAEIYAQREAVDKWRAQLGQSLVGNLNASVMRQSASSAVRPIFIFAYLLTLATVGAALVLLAAR